MPVRTPLLLAAGLLAGTLLPLSSPASADTGPVPLGMTALGRIVLDEAHGHLFLSEGPRGTGVHVTDLAGSRVTTVPGLAGATGMALTPDGASLWVAVPAAGLARVDTSSLEVVQRIDLPAGTCAGDVAVAGDRLVYAHSCRGYAGTFDGFSGGLAVVDAADGTPRGATSGAFLEPRVTAGPAGQVYVGEAGRSLSSLAQYDVSGSAMALVAERQQECSAISDLAASPDGALVAPVCGSPYRHDVLSGTSQLQTVASHDTGPFPVAAAWSGDGSTFAAGTSNPAGPDVRMFGADSGIPQWTFELDSTADLLVRRGLAVSRDGARVWAVTGRTGAASLTLHVLRVGEVTPPTTSTLTLTAIPREVEVTAATRIAGQLSSGEQPVEGATLVVTRSSADAAAVPLPSVLASRTGSFSFEDVPPAAGDWTYTVAWAGDRRRTPVESTVVVRVRPRPTTTVQLELARGATPGTVTGRVVLSSSVGASLAGRSLELDRNGTPLARLTTDALGSATFGDEPGPGRHTYTVRLLAVAPATGTEATGSNRIAVAPLPVASTLTAAVAPGGAAGTPLAVGGTLTTSAGPVAGAAVSVVRSGCGPADWTAPSTTTAGDGRWSVTDPAPEPGTCTYLATSAGSADRTAASASAQAVVALQSPTLSLTVARGTGSAKQLVQVTAVLGPTRSNRTVRITAQSGRGRESLLVEGTVDATGRLTTTERAKGGTTYRVVFTGDEWFEAATAVRTP